MSPHAGPKDASVLERRAMTVSAASAELPISPAADIATAVLAKEAEVNALRQNHIQVGRIQSKRDPHGFLISFVSALKATLRHNVSLS